MRRTEECKQQSQTCKKSGWRRINFISFCFRFSIAPENKVKNVFASLFTFLSGLVCWIGHRNFAGNQSLHRCGLFQIFSDVLRRLSHMALDASDSILCARHFTIRKADCFLWQWLCLVFQSTLWNQEPNSIGNWSKIFKNDQLTTFAKINK